jgi:hypothetical protein
MDGWDGTATVKEDETGAAWAIFAFNDDKNYKFDYLTLQTDNGTEDDALHSRQAVLVDVSVSQTGTLEGDFATIARLRIKDGKLNWYPLGKMVQAKFLKLAILEPKWGDGGWRQLVEFGVNSQSRQGAILVNTVSDLASVPAQFKLGQNYPNPFNPETTIRYQLAEETAVTVKVFDIQGREVAMLVNQVQSAGVHSLLWQPAGLPSGIYFCYFKAGSHTSLSKMLLTR